ncbi:hypothetical protein [Streptomyces sp. NPDC056323]|uniref:hypothetical protein n=1 Tax=unclassified Streptomyces TaxID=2593676 RepID=UPI0035DAF006
MSRPYRLARHGRDPRTGGIVEDLPSLKAPRLSRRQGQATNTVVPAEGTNSGTGPARPWIPPTAPTGSDTAVRPKTTEAGFTTIATACNVKMQPNPRVFAHTAAVGGTATSDVQSAINGSARGASVSAGSGLDIADITDIIDGVEIGEQFTLDVQARRLTGTGSIAAQVRMIYGRQT